MLEWLKAEIRRICNTLDFNLFLSQDMRARLLLELSVLAQKREKYEREQNQMVDQKSGSRN